MTPKLTGFILALLLLLASAISNAKTITVKDNLSGYNLAATNSLNDQAAGAGGRQVLFVPITITVPTVINRAEFISNINALPAANGFSFSVRESTAPYGEINTGAATRTNRTVYADVTLGGNNTHLDQFSLTTQLLQPGDYFFSIYASDGNTYQLAADTANDPEALLAESGGVPFLAGVGFHLFFVLQGTSLDPIPVPTLSRTLLPILACFLFILAVWRFRGTSNRT